ncbi:MAG TPA: asparagine synthase (glutamine-hydrolyzing) [Gemmatimonadaceae bacterium]|nr:asparagine synthase (glutamine-hydrolyzing) [Gemmatimonadaceae bacterium]
MCGIAGRAAFVPMLDAHAAKLSEAMQRALHNRGPDSGAAHHDGDVLIVHRRLSIIDLSDAGRQPLWNEQRTIAVIVNGEIYNFQSLRADLEKRGHRFRSHSDSEVLVHLYEDGGIDACCTRASGMFAFALWDARTRDLYLVRDRLGIKPLVICEHDEGVTFASTLAGLMADAAVPREVRTESLASVLHWGFVPSPWSALAGARRIPRGTWARVRGGRVVEEREWWRDDPAPVSTDDDSVRDALTRAVESHLVADVPIGALLSAGIDSGLVTAVANRVAGAGGIEAWTVSHRGHAEDEYAEASRVAAHLGVRLHEMPIGGTGLTLERFDEVVAAMDEPLADASLVGLHALFRAISADRRVVLSGDGGDELFAGYDWHAGMPAVPSWARQRWFRAAAPGLERLAGMGGAAGVAGKVATHIRRHPALVYLDKLRMTSDGELEAIGVSSISRDPMADSAVRAWEHFEGQDTLEQMLAVERATSLVDQMLAKVDTAAMAYGVEARVPFLADDVVRVAKGLPSNRKRVGSLGKICLRDWYRSLLPNDLAVRAKTGFNSPISAWLTGEIGSALRERAADGIALLGGSGVPTSPRTILAAAILASWTARFKQPSLATTRGF